MRGIKITRYGVRPFRLTTVKPGNGIGIMFLRELSNAEAPEDGLLDTTSFVEFTRDTGMVSKIGELFSCWCRSDLPNRPLLEGCPLWRPKFSGTRLSPSLHKFERFIVASALEIVRQARIDRAGQCGCQFVDLFRNGA